MLKHEDYITRIKAHIEADNFIRGETWDGSKGCAIGCTFEYYDHARAANDTNVPEWLWRLEDTLFEGMSERKSRTWPLEFFRRDIIKNAIDGATYDDEWWMNKIQAPFLITVLESTLDSFDHKEFPDVKAAVDGSIALWQRDDIGSDDWKEAAEAATRVAEAARTAAWAAEAEAAAWAARTARAAARAATRVATWAAAEAAEAAARTAEAAARAAARAATRAAEAATRAAEAAWVARTAKYDYFADELLRILDEAGMAHQKKGE